MISWLRTWSNQIIVAIIIATIFEMILPNGNNKKYIKMIIGLYVLFTIIHPIITKITGNELGNLSLNYKKYFDNSTQTVDTYSQQDFENNNSKLIEQTYIGNIKNDIKTKIKQKGYEVTNCNVNVINSNNTEDYGNVKSIEVTVKRQKEKQKNNIIEVNQISINTNNIDLQEDKSELTKDEKKYLKEYLSKEYSINEQGININ